MKCTNTQLATKCRGEFAPLPGSTEFHECRTCGYRIAAPAGQTDSLQIETSTPKKAKPSTTDKEN